MRSDCADCRRSGGRPGIVISAAERQKLIRRLSTFHINQAEGYGDFPRAGSSPHRPPSATLFQFIGLFSYHWGVMTSDDPHTTGGTPLYIHSLDILIPAPQMLGVAVNWKNKNGAKAVTCWRFVYSILFKGLIWKKSDLAYDAGTVHAERCRIFPSGRRRRRCGVGATNRQF